MYKIVGEVVLQNILCKLAQMLNCIEKAVWETVFKKKSLLLKLSCTKRGLIRECE